MKREDQPNLNSQSSKIPANRFDAANPKQVHFMSLCSKSYGSSSMAFVEKYETTRMKLMCRACCVDGNHHQLRGKLTVANQQDF
jgi:hypothetical protein